MPVTPLRFFFDTSVYIAALLSTQGAAGELLRLAEAGALQMVVSEQVIAEADRVLGAKFPELLQESRRLWKNLRPEIAPLPSVLERGPFLQKLARGDAFILAAAYRSSVAAFITWNTRDFMAPGISSLVDFPILVPADGLKLFRKWIDPLLG